MNDVTDTVHGASQYELRILFPVILPLFVLHTNVMFKNHIAIVVQHCQQARFYLYLCSMKYTPHELAINVAEPNSIL